MVRRALGTLVALIAIAVASLAAWLHEVRGWHAAIALLAAACVPVLVHAAILGQQFAITAWLRRRSRPDLAFGTAAWLRAWAGEIVASLRTFFYAQIRYGAQALPSGSDRERLPVLLVHGYFCNRGIWLPFARWLAARGHAVDSVNLEPMFGSIDDYVPIVAAGVDRLRARTGAPRIALVAHSMGGLVVRAYLAAGGHQAVAAAITLGTPHRGTWLARFGTGRNVAQMRPDCDWLRALATRETATARVTPITVVLSHHDNIVAPQSIQTLDGVRTIELAGRGHVELAYDREVWSHVAGAIDAATRRQESTQAPGPGTPGGQPTQAPEAGTRAIGT